MTSQPGQPKFDIGGSVRVRDDVRPLRYAGRVGSIARLNDGEVGLDFSAEASIDNLRADAWFRAEELAPNDAIDSLSKASGRPANPIPGGLVPVSQK